MKEDAVREVVYYVRDDRVPTGMLLCREISKSEARVGFCCLHEKDFGRFDKRLGYLIARGRAESRRRRRAEEYPKKLQKHIIPFLNKCEKVFPNKKIVI